MNIKYIIEDAQGGLYSRIVPIERLEEEGLSGKVVARCFSTRTKNDYDQEFFEGDIIESDKAGILHQIEYDGTRFAVKNLENGAKSFITNWQNKYKVIGNAYLNPELIKKAEDTAEYRNTLFKEVAV